jgi:hypothetical protein
MKEQDPRLRGDTQKFIGKFRNYLEGLIFWFFFIKEKERRKNA